MREMKLTPIIYTFAKGYGQVPIRFHNDKNLAPKYILRELVCVSYSLYYITYVVNKLI